MTATEPRSTDLTVWTIGHSNRPLDEFLALLTGHRIERLADVRRYPGSRKYPHFNPDPLRGSLAAAGIDYIALTELGGRRRPAPDSHNDVWRNDAFRGYADYMETPPFDAALMTLMRHAAARCTAIMCSEAVWWRCHRSMIADALKARGVRVLHIMGEEDAREHPFTAPARVIDGKLAYPSPRTDHE